MKRGMAHRDGDNDCQEECSNESLDGLLGTELNKLVTTEEHACVARMGVSKS